MKHRTLLAAAASMLLFTGCGTSIIHDDDELIQWLEQKQQITPLDSAPITVISQQKSAISSEVICWLSRSTPEGTDYYLVSYIPSDTGIRMMPEDHTDAIQRDMNAGFLHWDDGRMHRYYLVNDPRIASMVIHVYRSGQPECDHTEDIVVDTTQQPFCYCFTAKEGVPYSRELLTADGYSLETDGTQQANAEEAF